MAIPPSGNLKTTSLSDLIENLRAGIFSGTLVIQRKDISKNIYFKDGVIVFASSTDTNDRLGETLVRLGKISQQQLDRALSQFRQNAGLKKMGAVLVESGAIPAKDLFNGLKLQIREIVVSVFLMPDGTYRIERNLPTDLIVLPMDMQELIREVIMKVRQQA
jgi:hypothetical protein